MIASGYQGICIEHDNDFLKLLVSDMEFFIFNWELVENKSS